MKHFRQRAVPALCASLGTMAALAAMTGTAAAQDAAQPPQPSASAAASGSPADSRMPMTKNVVAGDAGGGGSQEGYADAVSNVAGVTSNNGRGTANASIMMRGIQLNLFTSYRLNGGLPTAGVISSPTENKELIETLKGANALMFGIASPGGIVNLVTKRAGAKDVTSLTLSGNSFGQVGVAADIGRRFGEDKQFGVRANLSATHLENGVDGGSGNGKFASIAADWRVTSRLTLKADLEHYTRDVVEQGLIAVLAPVNGVIAVPSPPDPTKLLSGPWAKYTPQTDNAQLRADYALNDRWKVMAEAGRSESSRSRFTNRIIDYDLQTGAGTNRITVTRDQEYVNEFYRTELDGRFATGPIRHDLTLGVSSSERDASQPVSFNVNQPQNIYDPIPQVKPPIPSTPPQKRPQVSKDVGLYVYDTLSIGRQWKVLAGLRRTTYDADNTLANGTHATRRSHTTSPAFGVLYDVRPQLTLFASVMKGLEETGSAPVGTLNQFEILPPAEATQFEVGVRGTVAGVNANLAFFDIQRANALTDPVSNIFLLDGENNFRGVEATLSADLGSAWSVNASGQYLKATQDPEHNLSLKGRRPENIPTFTANLGVRHRLAAVKGLNLTAGLNYVGARYVDPLNLGEIPGVVLATLGASYSTRLMGYRTQWQLNVDNLTNKRYWNSVGSGAYGAGMERSLRFSAKAEF